MYIDIYIIIASLKSEPMGKLLNRIPSLRLLISSLLGLVGEHNHSQALPSDLDIKSHLPSILYFH